MGFSRQKWWSGLPFPSPGDLSDPGIEPGSPALWEDALPSEPPGKRYSWCHRRIVISNSLWPYGLYSPWNSLGQNTGVGSLSLLQEIFPTQGLNPGLPQYRQILYQLSHQGSVHAYNNTIHNSQKSETTSVSINQWITKCNTFNTMKYYSAIKRNELLIYSTIRQILQIMCLVKETSHKKPCITRFHLWGLSRINKFRDSK